MIAVAPGLIRSTASCFLPARRANSLDRYLVSFTLAAILPPVLRTKKSPNKSRQFHLPPILAAQEHVMDEDEVHSRVRVGLALAASGPAFHEVADLVRVVQPAPSAVRRGRN